MMTGTFEIVFAGLCFLLLGGTVDDGGYEHLQVNLPQTSGGGKAVCEGIELYEHVPYLVIPTGQWEIECSHTVDDGECDLEAMGCRAQGQEWWCNLNGRELSVEVEGQKATNFNLAEGRDGRANRPADERDEKLAFDWITHLARIDGNNIARLKQEVGGPVGEGKLIASRIHASHGELSTLELGVPYGKDKAWSWEVQPERQPGWPWQEDHPKVVAEAMLLQIEAVESVSLKDEDCRYWKFKAGDDGPYRLRVQHFPANSEDRDHEWTVGTDPYPHRIRDFLWYYHLVEWMDGECPGHLSAPVCPKGNCKKKWPAYLPAGEKMKAILNANHFCQPTTYP